MSIRSKHTLRPLIALLALALGFTFVKSHAQTNRAPASQPNPYRTIDNWAQLPQGRKWGQTSAIDVDSQDHVWVADRCGGTSFRADSKDDPIFEFDTSGKLLKNFGAGVLVYPHGMFVDKAGNVWVTDAQAVNGKGQQVFKFSPEGKVLLTLGAAGISGGGPNSFNQPSDVLVAPNGNIFVADGHAPNYFTSRIVKFSSDGKFIKTWGVRGSAPGDFLGPHALAMDSKGRLFVGDRSNSRIQIFDQDGKFLAQWKQFGRPSGLPSIKPTSSLRIGLGVHQPVHRLDRLAAQPRSAASAGRVWVQSRLQTRHPRPGSAKDGKVTAFIPDPAPETPPLQPAPPKA